MASSGAERSLTNISLPQWMKTKIGDRYDLDQSAFSPPTDDDGFLHMRYRPPVPVEPEVKPVVVKAGNLSQQDSDKSISKLVSEKMHISDTVRHTLPCQQFIPKAKVSPRDVGLKYGEIDPLLGRVTSVGTDDGFKGEGAACGYSVVAVAHQMIAERKGERMFTQPKQRVRRNSRSLPASPHSSPQMSRKNPFFTNVIFGSTESVDNANNNFSTDVKKWEAKFAEIQQAKQEAIKPLPKPSELREMNFWSPTSM